MKISEVVDKLQELQKEHGDIDVRVWADHSQLDMISYSVEIMYAVGDEYMIEGSRGSKKEMLDDYGEEPNYCFVSISG